MSNSKPKRLLKIGITGPSGAGKTTQAKYFGENSNFTAFEGDRIMFKGLTALPHLSEKLFGGVPEPGKERDFAYSHYLPLTFEKERAIFELMRDYVEEQLVWATKKENLTTDFSSHHILGEALLYQAKDPNGKLIVPKGIVIEMCGFHRATHLARETDFTVLVDSNRDTRKKMLEQRGNMSDFIKLGKFDEIIDIRETVQGELLSGVKPHVFLLNRYNDRSLKHGYYQILWNLRSRGIEI